VVNYTIGRFFGARLFRNPDSKLFRRDYLLRAQAFFAQYGGRAIVLTRFAPIIRTFVPFAAGMSGMNYPRFLGYNVAGGVAWVGIFLYAGYHFGNLPAVRQNFTLIILAIVVVSFIPVAVEAWRARRN
jgi:membrane-associated protein